MKEVTKVDVERIEADYSQGLSTAQVEERIRTGNTNAAVKPPMKTTGEIFRDNICTYFNLIFGVLAVLVILVGHYKSLTFMPVIIANTVIGIFQELRAKKILEKMNMLNAPTAIVIRDGQEEKVDSEKLVLDDIVMFQAGNQICADAIVVEGEIKVNEALLTGESDEIVKGPGSQLMSGSIVVSGKCHARLEKVGADSYISKLIIEAKKMNSKEQSEMLRSLNKLVKWAGIAIIPVGAGLFIQSYFFNHIDLTTSVAKNTVTAVIGMIPEGLYLLATIAFTVSTIRLAQKKVLLHDMKSIETLARVDVLCVDKTGTITENTMVVHSIKPLLDQDLNGIISDFGAAMEADNITMEALKNHFQETTGRHADQVYPFSSVYKYSGAVLDGRAYVLGAPEYVLREEYDNYKELIEGFANEGLRALIFAEYEGQLDGKRLTDKVIPLGVINFTNPIRENAVSTFQYFKEQGVAIKVISGDNPLTVSRVALEAGIDQAEHYVDATGLANDDDIRDAMEKYTVFGRVAPEQKRAFVRVLKEMGHTVAMTGDGVNDVLALKDADCSVAMASGSEAAAQSAQVVLLDSDFSKMPSVVLEGRRTVNNIERSASLFLVKNIFSLILAIITLIFVTQYPLWPSQITMMSVFTIGVPGFFLAMEPNHEIIRGNFIKKVLLRALPAGLTDIIVVELIVNIGHMVGIPTNEVSTVAAFCLVIVGFMIIYTISKPMNYYRIGVMIINLCGIAACYFIIRELLMLEPFNMRMNIMMLSAGVASLCIYKIILIIVDKLKQKYFPDCV